MKRVLAHDTVQPTSFVFTPENASWVERIIGQYPPGKQASAVVQILLKAQDQHGWLPKAAIEWTASRLNMPKIRVLEIATFYTQFHLNPVGKIAHIQVCGTTPCMLCGSEAIIKACKARIHAEPHHISSDGNFSWEEVECLGACVNAPMVAIGRDTYEDLTVQKFTDILDALQAGQTPRPGPQSTRTGSYPEGVAIPTILTES